MFSNTADCDISLFNKSNGDKQTLVVTTCKPNRIGPASEVWVLIVSPSIQGLDEPVHMQRAFPAHMHKLWK